MENIDIEKKLNEVVSKIESVEKKLSFMMELQMQAVVGVGVFANHKAGELMGVKDKDEDGELNREEIRTFLQVATKSCFLKRKMDKIKNNKYESNEKEMEKNFVDDFIKMFFDKH